MHRESCNPVSIFGDLVLFDAAPIARQHPLSNNAAMQNHFPPAIIWIGGQTGGRS